MPSSLTQWQSRVALTCSTRGKDGVADCGHVLGARCTRYHPCRDVADSDVPLRIGPAHANVAAVVAESCPAGERPEWTRTTADTGAGVALAAQLEAFRPADGQLQVAIH